MKNLIFVLALLTVSTNAFAVDNNKITQCKCQQGRNAVARNQESFRREFAKWSAEFSAINGIVVSDLGSQLPLVILANMGRANSENPQAHPLTLAAIVRTCYGSPYTAKGLNLRPYVEALWQAKNLNFDSLGKNCGN